MSADLTRLSAPPVFAFSEATLAGDVVSVGFRDAHGNAVETHDAKAGEPIPEGAQVCFGADGVAWRAEEAAHVD